MEQPVWHHHAVAPAHQLATNDGVFGDEPDRGSPCGKAKRLVPNVVDLGTLEGILNVEGIEQRITVKGWSRLLTKGI